MNRTPAPYFEPLTQEFPCGGTMTLEPSGIYLRASATRVPTNEQNLGLYQRRDAANPPEPFRHAMPSQRHGARAISEKECSSVGHTSSSLETAGHKPPPSGSQRIAHSARLVKGRVSHGLSRNSCSSLRAKARRSFAVYGLERSNPGAGIALARRSFGEVGSLRPVPHAVLGLACNDICRMGSKKKPRLRERRG